MPEPRKYKRMCAGKIRHATKDDARSARYDAKKQNGGHWDVYQCPLCLFWHIGHKTGSIKS